MVSYLINTQFARPLEGNFGGTVVNICVTSSKGDEVIWSRVIKEKSCMPYGFDTLTATRKKARRLYLGVLRVLTDSGITRSQLRREGHTQMILKLVRREYEKSFYFRNNDGFSYRLDWDPSRDAGDRLSLISESNSPIGSGNESS